MTALRGIKESGDKFITALKKANNHGKQQNEKLIAINKNLKNQIEILTSQLQKVTKERNNLIANQLALRTGDEPSECIEGSSRITRLALKDMQIKLLEQQSVQIQRDHAQELAERDAFIAKSKTMIQEFEKKLTGNKRKRQYNDNRHKKKQRISDSNKTC